MTSQVITSPIPSDLADIPGIVTGFRPVPVNRGRYVLCGRGGCGKSTLLHSNPKAFILDPEEGGNTVDDPKAICYAPDPDQVPEGSYAEAYMDVADRIITRYKQGKREFELLGIDTLDELIEVFLVDFCRKHKLEDPLDYKSGEGNAYSIVRRDIFRILDRAHRAGMGWVLLCHVTPKTIRQAGEERVVQSLAVSDSFRNAVFRKCEHMMFMDYFTKNIKGPLIKKVIKGKTVSIPGEMKQEIWRVLKTKPGGLWKGESTSDVKVRVPFPDSTEIPRLGGWNVVTKAYDEAVKTLTQGVTT
jgi:hypothetical protein